MKHPIEQIDFKSNGNAYVIEASAGTGKTWTIERLYIKAILEATHPDDTSLPLSIQNILVVTFTNDATKELKERLYAKIEATIDKIISLHNNAIRDTDIFTSYLLSRGKIFDYKKDVRQLTNALQNFDQAAIFTIHGFCNKILRDYQFECQIDAEFELVRDKRKFIEQTVLNFLRSQVFTYPKFEGRLDIVLRHLDNFFSGDKLTPLLERIVSKLPSDLFKIKDNNYQLKYTNNPPGNIDFLLQDDLDDVRLAKAMFLAYLIDYIYKYYPLLCKQNKTVSHDEVLQKTADSLNNVASLKDKVFNNFPLAFIDEFQDTDLLQWEIFSRIYNLNAKLNSKGNVVVVGDPKQAIYRFRGADVDTYIEARNTISHNLSLLHNYRSHPNIMNFINQLFDLDNQGYTSDNSYLGDGINYQHIIASSEPSLLDLPGAALINQRLGGSNVCYDEQVQIVSIGGGTKQDRTGRLLRAMTFEILALLSAAPDLKGKIAVLVTKNKEAIQLVKYFGQFGIKATQLKLGNIFATRTASELYRILIALSDLANTRNRILAITTKIFNISLIELNDPDSGKLSELFAKRFFRYKQIWDTSGIFSLIYAILEDATKDGNNLSNRELANLWQLAELLNKQSTNNKAELLFWFKERITRATANTPESSELQSEELIRMENDDEQIIITTQHNAKGLEYEILFCPYFKSSITLDGVTDFNYRRPFFGNYRRDGHLHAEQILDKDLGEYIVNKDNKEIHRLNYVALTRAKSRIYIYLKQNTVSKNGKYNDKQKPDKLAELFGYVKTNPKDLSHKLFNYPKFFENDPSLALKDPGKLPGVIVYNRNNLTDLDLVSFKLDGMLENKVLTTLSTVRKTFKVSGAYTRQSYTGLTKDDEFGKDYDYYERLEAKLPEAVDYKYQILMDKELTGAAFGTLFHELCELYPFTEAQLNDVMFKYNVQNKAYGVELNYMLKEAFNYPILGNQSLSDFPDIVHELEFNVTVKNTKEIYKLLADYFGPEHPFTFASRNVGEIQSGFLVGFMDVCFRYKDKYWVLDYKTNSLSDYSGSRGIHDINSPIIESMAEHNYYLQYLLYLVALKRYLECRLKISDATDLIGGAVYYYVRGIYTKNTSPGDGIFIDDNCSGLVSKIDKLLEFNHE